MPVAWIVNNSLLNIKFQSYFRVTYSAIYQRFGNVTFYKFHIPKRGSKISIAAVHVLHNFHFVTFEIQEIFTKVVLKICK